MTRKRAEGVAVLNLEDLMNLQISDEYRELLEKLAQERGKTPVELMELLIKGYDEHRHVIWSSLQRKHVRVKCGYDDCFESRELKSVGDIRD